MTTLTVQTLIREGNPSLTLSCTLFLDIVNYGLDRTRYLVDILERKIYDEGQSLSKSDPAHFVAVFNKQTQKAKELSKYGYATLEASSLLTKQYSSLLKKCTLVAKVTRNH